MLVIGPHFENQRTRHVKHPAEDNFPFGVRYETRSSVRRVGIGSSTMFLLSQSPILIEGLTVQENVYLFASDFGGC